MALADPNLSSVARLRVSGGATWAYHWAQWPSRPVKQADEEDLVLHPLAGELRISLISPLWFAGIRHPVSRVFAAFSEAASAADAGRQFIP
jgi:hypothetical protein